MRLVHAGPERLFRVEQRHCEDGALRGSMPVGSWLAERDGTPRVGALGVLIDNVLGNAIIAGCPHGQYAVSTEITLDAIAGLPGRGVRAEARCIHVTSRTGYAVCEVVDAAGAVIARGTQRGWYVPAGNVTPDGDFDDGPPPEADNLWDLLRLRAHDDHGSPYVELVASKAVLNPLRNLHGGISLCVSELAAHAALARGSVPTLTTASIHVAYTRAVPADSTVRFDPVVVHRGRSLAVVDVTGSVGGRTCTSARITAQAAAPP